MTEEFPQQASEDNASSAQAETQIGPEQRINELELEVKESHEKYLRLLAEMENSKKRLTKEKQEMTRFGIENVIADFLLPMDNLENALKFTHQMSEETRNWAIGFEMILNQFKEVLSEHGVSSFNSLGENFDPYLHEAVEVEETETVQEGKITQEFVKGYKSSNRTIRPAKVKVAKKPCAPSEESKN
ncbi:MAG: nucleotide exchange factor GrpE [Chlamydiae bacterium]|nr:nucleotide exchange factor GrpE [Chlamydiota bacterium]